MPAPRHTSSSSCWRATPSVPGLGEAHGDDEQRAHAGGGTVAGDLDDVFRRHDDDRELDRSRNVADRVVRRKRLDDIGLRVDRVDDPLELRAEEVAQHLGADGSPPTGGADDGDRLGLQEALDGGDRGHPLALLESLLGDIGERGGQLDRDRVRRRVQVDREAALPEHVDHPVVVRQHLGGERGDVVHLGDAGEMGEQDRRDPVPLPRVGDEERDLGPVIAGADVGGVGDDRLAADRHEREPVRVVDVDGPLRHPVERRGPEEAEPDRLRRERLQELADLRLVVGAYRADANRRPIAQHDVCLALARIRRAHAHVASVGLQRDHPIGCCYGFRPRAPCGYTAAGAPLPSTPWDSPR